MYKRQLLGQRVNRVRADVEGVGDEPPDFVSEISVTFAQVFGGNDKCEQELREDLVLERLQGDSPAMSLLLQRLDLGHDAREEAIASDASHSEVEEGVSPDCQRGSPEQQAKKVLLGLVSSGYLEEIPVAPAEEAALVANKYRRSSSVPQLPPEAVVLERKKRGKFYLKRQERIERALPVQETLDIFKDCKSDIRLR